MRQGYDVILVGSGFSSVFFLHTLLRKKRDARILLIERGPHKSWEWQVKYRRTTDPVFAEANVIEKSGLPGKEWAHNIALGGGSNCWWANAMRLHPNSFRLHSAYGVGVDWPLSYDDLEPYYCEAEELMNIAGDPDSAVMFPRSRPFPQPRHRFSQIARTFKDRYPDTFFAMPQARARIATEHRNACCSNSVCGQCPANAKFMVIQDMASTLADKRVEVRTDTQVTGIIAGGGRVTGVSCVGPKGAYEVNGDLVVLGANAIYNPFLMLKSGIDHGPVGKGLTEQMSVYVHAYVGKGLNGGDGSAHITGVGYNFSHGDFRRQAAGGFYELTNLASVRPDKKDWRSMLTMTFLVNDLRQDRNNVSISRENPEKPLVHFEDWSSYAHAGQVHIRDNIEDLLSHLDLQWLNVSLGKSGGHAHLEGTTVMGRDPATSVIDPDMVHHKLRNLVVLGSGAFPTAGDYNPTLTLSALALRSADRLF